MNIIFLTLKTCSIPIDYKINFKLIFKLNHSKTCVKRPLSKRPKIGFQDQSSVNAGQKYCRILLTFIKLPFVMKTFVLSIFEWPFYTGFTVV